MTISSGPGSSSSGSAYADNSPVVLENGNSFGVTCLPPTGNTSIAVRFNIFCYELLAE